MADLCRHDLHRCTICDPIPGTRRRHKRLPSDPHVARIITECAVCSRTVAPGDTVTWSRAGVTHLGCAHG